MHRLHNEPKTSNGPQTTGTTLPGSTHYDVFSDLLGMGVNGRNSRMVIELAKIKPGDSVLDVACGTGSLTLTALSYTGASGKVYGIDASPGMIEVARRKVSRSAPQVNFQVGLAEKLDFPDASFEAVISRLAIHHLPDDLKGRAFVEILRVLKPGGRLMIVDFNPPSNPILAHLASALAGHKMMMSSNVSGLPALLSEAGYTDVSSGPTASAFLAFVCGRKPGS